MEEINNIVIFLILIFILYLIYCDYNKKNRITYLKNKFDKSNDTFTNTNLNINESIKNLGILSKKIINLEEEEINIPFNMTVPKLHTQYNNIIPFGTIMIWAPNKLKLVKQKNSNHWEKSTIEKIPDGWVECNGKIYLQSKYVNKSTSHLPTEIDNFRDLIKNVPENMRDYYFQTPDLISRIPVAEGKGENLSNRIAGQTGGNAKSKLKINQIPPHKHYDNSKISYKENGESHQNVTIDIGEDLQDSRKRKSPQISDGVHLIEKNISTTNRILGHSNMPPFTSLIYIIKT